MRNFRGLTKEGKWTVGWYAEVEGNHFIISDDTEYGQGILQGNIIGSIEVIPETVGQFTGLKDKTKEEYYFDDIAKWNNKLWIVVWSITLAGIELQPLANYRERQKNPETKRLYGTSFGIGQAHSSERIGNIHQNLELYGAR